ncbi:hypothetical protein ACC685_34430 [Rhizobium ruizarguesonis]
MLSNIGCLCKMIVGTLSTASGELQLEAASVGDNGAVSYSPRPSFTVAFNPNPTVFPMVELFGLNATKEKTPPERGFRLVGVE